jgi:peroxiredoxin
MKLLFILFAGITGLFAAEAPKVETLKIGAAAPAFKLVGVDDKNYTLEDFRDSKYLVMVFTCNHCPDARASWGRINSFAKDYADKGVQVVAISSNSPKALMLWENGYSVHGDSFPEMKLEAAERKLVFPYLYDGDKQEAGLAYGAQATPHVFIFGPERKLLYEGHFDNGYRNPGPASENAVRDNIDALLAGKPVIKERTDTFGCSTKWAFKEEWVTKQQKEWEALKVSVDPLSVESAKAVLENKTEKVRVINFWMTDSDASIADFPKLIDTYRRYERRPFDMVTIAIDPNDKAEEVLKVITAQHLPASPDTMKSLKKEGRETNNFHLKANDLETVVAMIGKEVKLSVPCTVVIAPGGKLLYHKIGAVDEVELRRAIVNGIEGLAKK